MLKKLLPSCFRGSKPSPKGITRQRTTQYETPIGRIVIIWTQVMITTRIYLTGKNRCLIFDHQINPSKAGERTGKRQFQTRPPISGAAQKMEMAWDFSRAKYRMAKDAQLNSNYYFCIAIDGQILLLEGDMMREARQPFTLAQNGATYAPVLREDTVDLKGRPYETKVNLSGKERDVSVRINPGKYASMSMSIDGIDVRSKSLWSEDEGSREVHSAHEIIRVSWKRQGWTPPKSKKNLIRFAPEREAAAIVLPKVVLAITCTRKDEPAGNLPAKSSCFIYLTS